MFNAVILAGGGKPEPLTEQEKVSNKAFIMLYGRPLLSYIIQALEETSSIEKIVAVGPVGQLEKLQKDGHSFEAVPEEGGMLDNLAAGFGRVNHDRLCLVVTSDIPLLTAEITEHFLSLCSPYDCDFYFPILRREDCVEKFPATERTYVHLDEGPVTGGNMVLLNPCWFLENRASLEMFISYRKKPLKLLRILPLALIIKYLRKRLSLSDLEIFISRLFNLNVRAVPCDCVEIGLDVDKPSDLDVVKNAMEGGFFK